MSPARAPVEWYRPRYLVQHVGVARIAMSMVRRAFGASCHKRCARQGVYMKTETAQGRPWRSRDDTACQQLRTSLLSIVAGWAGLFAARVLFGHVCTGFVQCEPTSGLTLAGSAHVLGCASVSRRRCLHQFASNAQHAGARKQQFRDWE